MWSCKILSATLDSCLAFFFSKTGADPARAVSAFFGRTPAEPARPPKTGESSFFSAGGREASAVGLVRPVLNGCGLSTRDFFILGESRDTTSGLEESFLLFLPSEESDEDITITSSSTSPGPAKGGREAEANAAEPAFFANGLALVDGSLAFGGCARPRFCGGGSFLGRAPPPFFLLNEGLLLTDSFAAAPPTWIPSPEEATQ